MPSPNQAPSDAKAFPWSSKNVDSIRKYQPQLWMTTAPNRHLTLSTDRGQLPTSALSCMQQRAELPGCWCVST